MIFLLGAQGQVGYELQRTLATLGPLHATSRATLDLTNEAAIRAAVREMAPRWIVNAAAYTAVDAAESDPAAAHWLNAEVPRILAEEAVRTGAWLVHYSTDYVFDGTGTRGYVETDPVAPQSVYGRTKVLGEAAVRAVCAQHLIFRVAWVYALRGRNFLLTVRRLAAGGGPLRMVDDQVGVPTWSRAIAEATAQVMAQRPGVALAGTYHMAGGGSCSWHGFARAILAADASVAGTAPVAVLPIPTSAYPTPATRPAWSVLDATKLHDTFGVVLPAWDRQLALCLDAPVVGSVP
jgi:dTDP-4-dehydrorhamnose reductase